jgi:hypothetical protein
VNSYGDPWLPVLASCHSRLAAASSPRRTRRANPSAGASASASAAKEQVDHQPGRRGGNPTVTYTSPRSP